MKKFCLFLVLIVACAALLCSCGNEPYNYDLTEYITLGTFPTVEYDEEALDKKITEEIETITSLYKEEKEITDRAIEENDKVNIDYSGVLEGETEPFNGGTAQGYDLLIGSDTFIDGFEDGLIGKKTGEEVKLDLVFPEDYSTAEYAGKKVVFTVKINKVMSVVYPELTDQMVKDEVGYETVEEFLEETRKMFLEEIIWENYINTCEVIKYPKKELKKMYDNYINMYKQMAYSNGISLESYIMMVGYTTEDAFYAEILSSARKTVKQEMALYLTVRNNDISFTDEEYDTIGLEIALEEGFETLKEFEDYVGKSEVENQVYLKLAVKKAIENAVAVSK